mgnify:CR=1 FL=1
MEVEGGQYYKQFIQIEDILNKAASLGNNLRGTIRREYTSR